MELVSLDTVDFNDFIAAMLKAFEGYFVKMPESTDYWRKRYARAKVDFEKSYAVKINGELAAMVVNAIDYEEGILTAYNTGTGVVPEHRGKKLIDFIYDQTIPALKDHGVSRLQLEVIDKNDRAIKLYERIGFTSDRKLLCYSGEWTAHNNSANFAKGTLSQIAQFSSSKYSWDFTSNRIEDLSDFYQLYYQDKNYFVINPESGYVAQLESKDSNWQGLFNEMAKYSGVLKINNVDENRKDLIEFLNASQLTNVIDQYEMSLLI